MGYGTTLDQLERALLAVDRPMVDQLVEQALAGEPPQAVIDRLLVPALVRVGTAWEQGQVALSQVYMAGRLAEAVTGRLLPQASPAEGTARAAVAVLEDQHVLGKQMVLAHLHAAAIPVVDLGQGLSAAALAERAAAAGVQVLLVSVLMLRSALAVTGLVEALRGRACHTRVVVGGAPFRLDPELWRRVGADAWGPSAADAPGLVRRLGGAS